MNHQIIVDSRVRLFTDGLSATSLRELQDEFTHENPGYFPAIKYKRPGWWEEKPTIATWESHSTRSGKTILSFPRGGLERVRAAIERGTGTAVEVVDNRTDGTGPQEQPAHLLDLYHYQDTAMGEMIDAGGGILRAPTGAGKTTVAFAYAAQMGLSTLIVVWNAGLFDQWVARAQKELGLRADEVGKIRGATRVLRPITIAMQQTLANGVSDEIANYFGIVFLDETQRAAAVTAFKAIDQFPARYRFGISADERRKDKKEFLTHDLFGPVVANVDRDALIESGHVLDVEIRVVPTMFRADWYGVDGDFNALLEAMTLDPARNALAIDLAETELDAGEQVLVMSHRVQHCQDLAANLAARGHRTGFLLGGPEHQTEFRNTVAELGTGRARAGVGTYPAIGTGLDIPAVAVAVATTPIGSNKPFFNQVRGRVCRVAHGKTGARLYYLWDRLVYPGHLKNLVAWNRTVNVWNGSEWVNGREYVRANMGGR